MKFFLLHLLLLRLATRTRAFQNHQGQGSSRHLEDQTVQRIDYQGRVKHVLGFWCEGSPPSIKITCENGGHLEMTGVSHNNIGCELLDTSNAVCTIGCDDQSACESIYTTDNYEDDTWASVYFACQAPTIEGTAATFIYDRGTGSCVASDSIFLDNFNFHIAELGPLCTNPNGSQSYAFGAHRFLECYGGPSVFSAPVSGRYTCIAGQNCDFQFCDFVFDPIILETFPSNIDVKGCIATRSGGETFVPGEVPAFTPDPLPEGDYTTFYQARWSHVIEDTFCESSVPVIQINCTGGELFLSAPFHESVECSLLDNNNAECTDTCETCNHFVGETTFSNGPQPIFSGINFECRGITLDQTTVQVTYLGSYTECASYLTSFWTSYHFLELGVRCGSGTSAEERLVVGNGYSFADNFVECGVGAGFDSGDSDGHYQCFAEAMFLGEESIFRALVPAVSMESEKLREGCFPETLLPPPTPSPTSSPTPSPSQSPTTSPSQSPTPSPSQSPTYLPTYFTTPPPIPSPTYFPTHTSTYSPTHSSTQKPTITSPNTPTAPGSTTDTTPDTTGNDDEASGTFLARNIIAVAVVLVTAFQQLAIF